MLNNNILFFGIDRAGKTALACSLASQEVSQKFTPTLGLKISNLILRDLNYKIYDLPGQKNLRSTWLPAAKQCGILIFVLDTSLENRFAEAIDELKNVIQVEGPKGKHIIICYNKMDLPDSKKNLPKAKEMVKKQIANASHFKEFETSAVKQEPLNGLQDELVSIIQGSRWD